MAVFRFRRDAVRESVRPAPISPTLVLLLVLLAAPSAPRAAPPQHDDVQSALAAIVHVKASARRSQADPLPPREGSGIVIDGAGLVLTVGYLVADVDTVTLTLRDGRTVPAITVAQDHSTGLGLIRALAPLGVRPVELGSATSLRPQDPAVVAGFDDASGAAASTVVSRKTFVGGWEYVLENAIFTAPAYPALGGAALLSADGRLAGIGALIVADGTGPDRPMPCNMFIPIDRLKPVLADLIEAGRPSGPRLPWLGLSSEEVPGRLLVTGVIEGGPAHRAGIRPGDLVLGIDGTVVTALDEFYRRLWTSGEAGATIALDVLKGHEVRRIGVRSADRYDFGKRHPGF